MPESEDDLDGELRRLLGALGPLAGQPDADGDGEPDGLVEPAATVGDEPLLFDRPVRATPKDVGQIVGGKPQAAQRAVAKVVSPTTLGRAAKAHGRGVALLADWAYGYYTAADKMDVRIKNPRLHHEITIDRRRRFFIGIGTVLLASLIILYAVGVAGAVAEIVAVNAVLMLVGKRGQPIINAEAGEDKGMSETRVQRAIARAVFNVNFDKEENKDWHRHIIVREGWVRVEGGDTMTIRLGLPQPHNALKAKAKEKDIAAALDLTVRQVRIVPDSRKENAGDFDLIVYRSDPWDISPTTLPCALHPQPLNLWRGIDFGMDIDRQRVRLEIIGKGVLIGGLPEMGKTTTALTMLSSIVLDPYVRLWVADAKGVDTGPLIPLAYRYVGASQDEFLGMLEEIESWGRRKLGALKEVGKVKFTEELCSMFRQMDPNHPLATIDVVYIDEARFYTNGIVAATSKKINAALSRILEVFRAAGIIVILATQRPHTDNIPSEIRDLMRVRIAHACSTPQMSDTVLGSGAAGEGYSAKEFDEDWAGVAWLRILKSYRQVRAHLTELAALENVCTYAYNLRQKAGTLPEDIDASGAFAVPQILLDVEKVLNEKEWQKVPTNVLLPLMARTSPEYDGMSAQDLAARLSTWGVGPKEIGEWTYEDDGKYSSNVRGYRLKWIQDAIARQKKEVGK